MDITWKYKCSICRELVHPDDMVTHVDYHKARIDWPGHISFKRVDDGKA